MNILDDLKKTRRLDRQNMLGSIDALGDQCAHGWRDGRRIQFPTRYRGAKKILVAGMGGSIIGAHLIESVFADSLSVPFIRVGGYHLPAWAGRDTLVVLSSYSGTTEEVLYMGREALKRGCMVTAITAGGTLGKLMNARRLPWYKIVATHNPSNQPRMATGYAVFGLLGMFSRLGYVRMPDALVHHVVADLSLGRRRFTMAKPQRTNRVKSIARSLVDKYVLFVGAEHLVGNAHIAANQLNENAKQFAAYFTIPELNHHLLEALRYPQMNRRTLSVIFFQSDAYHPRNQKRVTASARIMKAQGIRASILPIRGGTRLSQAMRIVQMCAYIGYYLAMLNRLDPAPIRWVDAFKRIMAQ